MPTVSHPPVEAVPDLDRWAQALADLAARPLEMSPEFPRIARRFKAWWRQQAIDRPIIMGAAYTGPPRSSPRRLDLLHTPDAWLDARYRDLLHTRLFGDMLPSIRVDFGPVLLGGLLGGPTEFVSDTTWTHTLINDDWSTEPSWQLDQDHPWWRLLLELLRRVAEHAKGRYLVCTPDLGGSGDVLLNLRGSSELCMDVIEQPRRIEDAVRRIYPAWRRAWMELYRQTVERGAGVLHWLMVWSDRPYMIPACDFNYMIGPAEFNRLLLPDIARQAATAGRGVFHLDGPGAARHIDALLEVPHIQAIQFTPGTGTPSVRPWIGMFRKIQSKGRSVLAICPIGEVAELCAALRPEGLAIIVDGGGPEELAALMRAVEPRT